MKKKEYRNTQTVRLRLCLAQRERSSGFDWCICQPSISPVPSPKPLSDSSKGGGAPKAARAVITRRSAGRTRRDQRVYLAEIV